MYVSEHLKWRILIAQALKSFHFERENANRNLKRVFETFGKYLLGTTYDTFLNYLYKEKYDISKLKLPPYILIALKLLDAIRLACDRLHARRPNASWTLTAIVEELLAVVREKETEHPAAGEPASTDPEPQKKPGCKIACNPVFACCGKKGIRTPETL